MTQQYVIEYVLGDGKVAYRMYAADTAFAAVDKFRRDHPEAVDVVELRRVHGT